MPERLRQLAHISVARGCGFASLAILCAMFAFAGDLPRSLKVGGYGAFFVTVVLLLKTTNSDIKTYKRTEIWHMLGHDERPPEALAGRMITDARIEAMTRWALGSALAALFLLGGGFLADLAAIR